MTVKVTIDLNRQFIVTADINSVFALLSDVPASAEHFPKVHALTALSDNVFRWEMEKVNLGTHSAQTSYACQYVSDSEAKTIVWTPIKGEGNSIVSGKWELTEVATGTNISFKTKAELTLPLPGLLKLMISPLVKFEFAGMVDTYLRNLKGVWV
jgi:carbon monoxide dehydrogenase subunit G